MHLSKSNSSGTSAVLKKVRTIRETIKANPESKRTWRWERKPQRASGALPRLEPTAVPYFVHVLPPFLLEKPAARSCTKNAPFSLHVGRWSRCFSGATPNSLHPQSLLLHCPLSELCNSSFLYVNLHRPLDFEPFQRTNFDFYKFPDSQITDLQSKSVD